MFVNTTLETLAEGVFISFVSSFIFFLYTVFVDSTSEEIRESIANVKNDVATMKQNNTDNHEYVKNEFIKFNRELDTNSNRIRENSDQIKEMVMLNTEANKLKEDYGILRIVKREDYSYEFWEGFLRLARDESNEHITLTGRTLGRWLEPKLRELFISTLAVLADKEAKIRLVVYKNIEPESNEEKEINDLKGILDKDIFPIIKRKYATYEEAARKLEILEVENLPYLFLSVNKEVVVSQYFKYAGNTDILMFVLDQDSPFANRYNTDFESLLRDIASTNDWLKDYYNNQP